MRSFVSHPGSIVLALALGCATSCVAIPDKGQQAALATHVEDWRDEVIYQVLIDRFANGDVNNDVGVVSGALARYQGGDWKGLEEHLDYLRELGVTTLWISPVVRNVETDADVDAYHGYWAQDLTEVNPHFGDLSELRSLTATAHERNMKVVLDIVTNHMGQVFYYDMNMNGNADIYIGGTGCDPRSPATDFGKNPDGSCSSPVTRITEFDPDWDPRGVQAYTSLGPAGRAPVIFVQNPAINRVPPRPGILGTLNAYHGMGRILNHDIPDQRLRGDFPGGLKDVATEDPEVRKVMIDSYARWAERADLDGYRIDTVKHVEHDFWVEFASETRKRLAAQGKAKFLMFGEAFDGNDELLGSYTQKGMLDGVFYFSQHFQVFRDVFQYAHDPKAQKGTEQIQRLWADKKKNYGNEAHDLGIGVPPYKALVNFLDNHDVARFLYFAQNDKDALRNALTLLMTEDGIPCLYYGTELDFAGGNDPANREILWESGFPTTGDTFRHFSKLARLRREYLALKRGDTNVVWATARTGDEADAGIFAFERGGGDAGDRYALVVLNTNARHPSTTEFDGKVMTLTRPSGQLVDVLDPALRKYAIEAGGTLRVTVPAQRAMILVPEEQLVSSGP